MNIRKLNDLVGLVSGKIRRKLVVAVAQDVDVLLAVKAASEAGIIEPILVGDQKEIIESAAQAGLDISKIEIVDIADRQQGCARAVKMVREKKADILMKGMATTAQFLRAILDKEHGLMEEGLLSHVAFFESPYYHKILCVTDAAMNISPDFNEKTAILNNAVNVYHKLGNPLPKAGILAAVETINPKMEATVHAAMMVAMQKRNQIRGCLIEGPLALDNAISAEAARHKGIESEIAGDVDILLVPDLNAGNILYKSLIFLGGSSTAAMVVGAVAPVVLTSRSDSDKSKFLSIALAAAIEEGKVR
jgi:phosphate butyryltransferase